SQAPAAPAARQGRHHQGLQASPGRPGHRRLIGLLDPAATATGDAGGLAGAVTLRPIHGAEQIARACLDVTRRAPGLAILERTVNGQPGLVAQHDGVTVTVFAFDIAGDRIRPIWAVRNPDKLRPWTTG